MYPFGKLFLLSKDSYFLIKDLCASVVPDPKLYLLNND